MSELAAVLAPRRVEPLCPIFGECGGCATQDLAYEDELAAKEADFKGLLQSALGLESDVFEPIVPSPKPYHYRSRLDLTLLRTRAGEHLMGFMPREGRRIVPAHACAIACPEISEFLPELARQAAERLPANYERANLVVRTSEDGRVRWGGIGPRSLEMEEKDYFWTTVGGGKIFYSLETFFQANLSILPALMGRLSGFLAMDRDTALFDLYAGVGLFGVSFAPAARRAVLIEEHPGSIRLAQFNVAHRGLSNVEIIGGRVEAALGAALAAAHGGRRAAIVDPPRAGLSEEACRALTAASSLQALAYLSCSPVSLARDLAAFLDGGWTVERVAPFDFFPKTRHLETLALLRPPGAP